MAFKEQESKFSHQIIDGNKVPVITPEVWATVTNTLTGKEYGSDAEATADVENPATETKREDIKRDVKIIVKNLPLGAESK
jgi:hypothetical protein|tara:strand:- start:236 stop:478 length:243 start_codon:yes stop_codon:yes gene_type:complete